MTDSRIREPVSRREHDMTNLPILKSNVPVALPIEDFPRSGRIEIPVHVMREITRRGLVGAEQSAMLGAVTLQCLKEQGIPEDLLNLGAAALEFAEEFNQNDDTVAINWRLKY